MLKLINSVKLQDTKLNIQKSVAFHYFKNELCEKRNYESNHIYNTIKTN